MFWIKLQTTFITSNYSINNIIKAGEDNMKTIQNSTILLYVPVACVCVCKVRGLNNAVPTSIQKQAGIRPPRHTTDTQSSMKTQGYTKQWPMYLCQGRDHSGTRHGRWQVEKKSKSPSRQSQGTRLSLALEVRVPWGFPWQHLPWTPRATAHLFCG